jgi:hypothetical protein
LDLRRREKRVETKVGHPKPAVADYALAEKNALYRCLDRLLAHKAALFTHLRERWQDLFGARFEVLLYDLTSTYFESNPPDDEDDKRRYGYSRDKRSDCVQVIIALIVTPEGSSGLRSPAWSLEAPFYRKRNVLVRLDVSRPNYLPPFLGVADKELSKLGGRACEG